MLESVRQLVEDGRHLEHFYSYTKNAEVKDTKTNTIDWRIDQGLILPNQWWLLGLSIQLPAPPKRLNLIMTWGLDFLEFTLGDGVNQYPDQKLCALPHALQVPALSKTRVWYGLMVLPPASLSTSESLHGPRKTTHLHQSSPVSALPAVDQ